MGRHRRSRTAAGTVKAAASPGNAGSGGRWSGGAPSSTRRRSGGCIATPAPDWPNGDWSIRITGEPEMHLTLPHSWNRDVLGSTAAHAINAIPYVVDAGPGVKTFLDLPLIAGRGSAWSR